jgi:hypothetical protein
VVSASALAAGFLTPRVLKRRRAEFALTVGYLEETHFSISPKLSAACGIGINEEAQLRKCKSCDGKGKGHGRQLRQIESCPPGK